MLRRTAATAGASSTPVQIPPPPIIKQSQEPLVDGTVQDVDESLSSSVFRRGGDNRRRLPKSNSDSGLSANGWSEDPLHRAARLDVQHRLRLMPAALWGERARRANDTERTAAAAAAPAAEATVPAPGPETTTTAAQKLAIGRRSKRSLAALGGEEQGKERGVSSELLAAGKGDNTSVAVVSRTMEASGQIIGGISAPAYTSPLDDSCGRYKFVLPVEAKFAEAASLKRPVVTARVPLRWQSRVVALSSLRDHGFCSPSRESSSGCRRRAGTKYRRYWRKRQKRCVVVYGVLITPLAACSAIRGL